MPDLGYIRVSSVDQNTERQLPDLKLDKTFTDKCSGSTTERPALMELIGYMREGDTVFVHSLDRLARNLQDLLSLVEQFKSKGVALHFHKEGWVFKRGIDEPMQDLLLSVMGAVAQFERALIRERQREGIEKAKAKGIYNKQRRKRVDPDKVTELLQEGLSQAETARRLNCSTKTVQRINNERRKTNKEPDNG